MTDERIRAEINRLYWESDASVADIAEQVGVSRRALYDQIEPRPAGVACPECGGTLGFRNRTAAENREAECPECGLEQALEDAGEPQLEQEATAGPKAPLRPPLEQVPFSGPALGGSMLAGLAVGAVVGWAIRRR